MPRKTHLGLVSSWRHFNYNFTCQHFHIPVPQTPYKGAPKPGSGQQIWAFSSSHLAAPRHKLFLCCIFGVLVISLTACWAYELGFDYTYTIIYLPIFKLFLFFLILKTVVMVIFVHRSLYSCLIKISQKWNC